MAESRGMTRDEIHEVAQGRVWTGVAAQEAGLIDVVGGIDRAIEIAAEKAEIEEWLIDVYPKRKDLFETLFSSGNAKLNAWMMSWIPEPFNSNEAQDLMMLMEQPRGTNWALLPIRFDVN